MENIVEAATAAATTAILCCCMHIDVKRIRIDLLYVFK